MPRIKTAEQFAAVMHASKVKGSALSGVWHSEHFAVHVAPNSVLRLQKQLASVGASTFAVAHEGEAETVIGVVCPKRLAKRAVTRNAMKRQIYAVSSALSSRLPKACVVVRLRVAFSAQDYPSAQSAALKAALRAELFRLLERTTCLPSQ